MINFANSMRKVFTIITCLSLGLAACNTTSKLAKSNDPNAKLYKANEYFEKKSYYKATELYGSLIPSVRGTKNFEELLYRYAYSFYNMKDYMSSSYQFKAFVDNFPGSTRAEECQFMYAKSLVLNAPKATLDQTSTIQSIAALQNFVGMNRTSKYLAEANEYLDKSLEKLETKDAGAAKLYYDMTQYKSSIVAYNSILQEYPTSTKSDYYQYMIVSSYAAYAKLSVKEKQEERYNEVINNFKILKEQFPESSYIKSAENLSKSAENSLKNIRNEHK